MFNYQLRKIQIKSIILEESNWKSKLGSASASSTNSSRSGSGWLEEDDDDAVNNINSTFTLKSINSSEYFSKLLKMVENGDF